MPGHRGFELVAQDEGASVRADSIHSRNALYTAVPCAADALDHGTSDLDVEPLVRHRSFRASGLVLAFAFATCIGICAARWNTLPFRVVPEQAKMPPVRQLVEVCNASVLVQKDFNSHNLTFPNSYDSFCQDLPNVTAMDGREQYYEGQNKCWAWTKRVGCYNVLGRLSWHDAQETAAQNGKAPNPDVAPLHGLRNAHLCERYHNGAAPVPSGDPMELENATTWLDQHVAVYVLNLDRDKARLDSFTKRLGDLSINFTRIAGVDLSVPNGLDSAYSDGLIPDHFNYTLAQEIASSNVQGMGGILGTVGCAAAHLNAIRIGSEDFNRSSKTLALVLEDDVYLADDFALRLRRLLETEAPCEWEVISLQSRCPYGVCVSEHLSRVTPDTNEPASRCHHGVNYGFFAMLYRLGAAQSVREKLSRVVWNATRPRCLDVDVALASISDEVAYYAVPSMQTPGFLSEGGQGSSRNDFNQIERVELIG